jgi:hypothetical protein
MKTDHSILQLCENLQVSPQRLYHLRLVIAPYQG